MAKLYQRNGNDFLFLMIYISGVTEHRYQAVNPKINPDESEFYEYVLKHVRAKDVGHLAEEMNDELLRRENGAQESVYQKLACALGITRRGAGHGYHRSKKRR
jgi:hypothetical protein